MKLIRAITATITIRIHLMIMPITIPQIIRLVCSHLNSKSSIMLINRTKSRGKEAIRDMLQLETTKTDI